MKAKELLAELEQFQKGLEQHHKLWSGVIDIAEHNKRNEILALQSRDLGRQLGRLKPYLFRFRNNWIMHHPATGVVWDSLESAVGMTAVPQIKGSSLMSVIDRLNMIIGEVQGMNPEDDIPANIDAQVRSGTTTDKVMLAYLQSLHPFIANGCTGLFVDGHYAQAIEESVKAIMQYIRNKTGLTIDGTSLVEKAFSLTSPMLTFSDLSDETKKNEQLGFMEMLKGFVRGVRHPLAHTQGRQEEAQNAFEYIVMASLFCRRIDEASPEELNI